MTNVTANGRYVCTGLCEDLSSRFAVDLLPSYVGFAEYWAAVPRAAMLAATATCTCLHLIDTPDFDTLLEKTKKTDD
jgi:hypothetical protein